MPPVRKPSFKLPSVDDAQIIRAGGPWTTRAGAKLYLRINLTNEQLAERFRFSHDSELRALEEESGLPRRDILGMRQYLQTGFDPGADGGGEFHRFRSEILLGLQGRVEVDLEDVYGKKKTVVLTASRAVLVPPFILHTFRSLQQGSMFRVHCNTVWLGEEHKDLDIHDKQAFGLLQQEY